MNPVLQALQAARAAEQAAAELKLLGLPWPPRGWDGKHKAMWFALPAELKKYTTQRENDRDAALKRAFNKVAEMKRKIQNDQQSIAAAAAGTEPAAGTAEPATDVATARG